MNVYKGLCKSTSLAGAIRRGESFLLRAQAEDGHWTDFMSQQAGESTQWVTAYIGGTLSLREPERPFLGKARDWLLHTELKGGGWGYKTDFLPDADSTANAALFLSRNSSRSETPLQRLGHLLLSFWHEKTGGFTTFRPLPFPLGLLYMSESSIWCKPEVSISAMAGLTLLSIDPGQYGDILRSVRVFLLDARDGAGFWESCWWDGRIYGTWISCEFLAQHGDVDEVEKSIWWLCSQITGEGGWGDCYGGNADPFNTALALAVFRLSGKVTNYSALIQKGIEWLLNAQNKDGSWMASAKVREPEPWNYRPWEAGKRQSTVTILDCNRLFTTATVLRALSSMELKFESETA